MPGTTTKESNSHPPRGVESSHKSTPQQKPSRTESRKVAAPQKSSSRAKGPVTSSAAVESTKSTASKRAMPVDVSNMKLDSVHVRLAKIKEQQDALDAKKAKAAAEMKEEKEKKRQEAHEERQKEIARKRHHWDPRFDTSYVNAVSASDGAAIEPQRNSTAKKGASQQQQPKKNKAKKPSTNKHGKRPFDHDDDDQVASEDSDTHMRKKARGSESLSSPREKSASAMPSSTQNSVTVYSAAVKAVPAGSWGMMPFGADGHAAQEYHDVQEQLFNKALAKFKVREVAKQVQKRSASEELPEPMAKKFKQSDEEKTLLEETQQAKEQPSAEAKAFKVEDIIEKPEVASSAGGESISFIDTASTVPHSHGTATGKDASATETESTIKEEAGSNNDDNNKSSSSGAEDSSNEEKKVAEQTSKTDTASADTSASQNDHQYATQGDNKTSQAFEEKSAESYSNENAKSTLETPDGQTSVNSTAPTTISGSAINTTTQQQTAQKSKNNNAQEQVANVTKKSANNSDSIDTDDEAYSATEKPAKKKPATKARSKPQRNEDQHPTTNKQGSAVSKKKPTSKGSAVKQPSASTQQPLQPRVTGAARFVPTTKEDRERAAEQTSRGTNKKPLADKTNTDRQSTKLDSKKTPAPRTKKQPKAAEEQSAPAKPAASKKRKHDGADVVESNPKPAEKKQHKEQSKKRSREDNEDEDDDYDAGSTKKNAKKQRTSLPSTTTSTQPDPDTSTSFNPDRASRSRAADAARPQVPKPRNEALWVDFDNEDQFKPQNEAQAQASGPVNKHEQTNGDGVEDGVNDDGTPSDASNGEDAPASNDHKPQPQMNKQKGVAQSMGEEQQQKKKKKKTAAASMSAAAHKRKVGRTLFHEG